MQVDNFLYTITSSIRDFKIMDAVDIIIVAILIYFIIKLTRKTRAFQVLKGVGFFVLFSAICDLIGLSTISWLLSQFLSIAAVSLVVLFQPELRRAFEKMGTGRILDIKISVENAAEAQSIEEIYRAVLNMSMHKVGALMVFEKKTGLEDVVESGTILDAAISSQLIENIFFKNSPLHDGAMIIRELKIAAAGCFLPLSVNSDIPSELGTRHRAAVGISEISDCSVIVVSEETGAISLINEGIIKRNLDTKSLRTALEDLLLHDKSSALEKHRKKRAKK